MTFSFNLLVHKQAVNQSETGTELRSSYKLPWIQPHLPLSLTWVQPGLSGLLHLYFYFLLDVDVDAAAGLQGYYICSQQRFNNFYSRMSPYLVWLGFV